MGHDGYKLMQLFIEHALHCLPWSRNVCYGTAILINMDAFRCLAVCPRRKFPLSLPYGLKNASVANISVQLQVNYLPTLSQCVPFLSLLQGMISHDLLLQGLLGFRAFSDVKSISLHLKFPFRAICSVRSEFYGCCGCAGTA